MTRRRHRPASLSLLLRQARSSIMTRALDMIDSEMKKLTTGSDEEVTWMPGASKSTGRCKRHGMMCARPSPPNNGAGSGWIAVEHGLSCSVSTRRASGRGFEPRAEVAEAGARHVSLDDCWLRSVGWGGPGLLPVWRCKPVPCDSPRGNGGTDRQCEEQHAHTRIVLKSCAR
jgi:hypothetical protein